MEEHEKETLLRFANKHSGCHGSSELGQSCSRLTQRLYWRI